MRILRMTVALGLLATLLVTGVAAAVALTHRPSERAYLRYVHTYGDLNGPNGTRAPAATRRQLLAGGARACAWLRDQPPALWRDDPELRVNALYARYRRGMGTQDSTLPAAFLPGAFTYLCPFSTYLRKPHLGFLHGDEGD